MNEEIYNLAMQDQSMLNAQISAELSVTRAKLHLAEKQIMELQNQLADRADDDNTEG